MHTIITNNPNESESIQLLQGKRNANRESATHQSHEHEKQRHQVFYPVIVFGFRHVDGCEKQLNENECQKQGQDEFQTCKHTRRFFAFQIT
jgi:hypothetical protein